MTPAGRSYVTAAKSILEQLNEAERAASGEYTEPKGDLVVTAPIMFGRLNVLPIVTRFLDAFPDVSVGVVITDRVMHFLEDQVDVAVRLGHLPDSSLVATRLGTVRHIVGASPEYLATNGAPSTPEDFARHRVISFQSVSALSTWAFEADGDDVATTFPSRLSVNTIDAAIDAALSGAGLVRAVSYQIADHVRAGRLALVLEEFEPKALPVLLSTTGRTGCRLSCAPSSISSCRVCVNSSSR